MSQSMVEFGYHPPTGQRGLEDVTAETFERDLANVLTIASQYFSSFWVSDHLMIGETYRLECWTQLTWIAARYPAQKIGTNVLANSFRHPALLAKMATTLQVLSHGRLILGYGAGWVEEEYNAYGIPFPSGRTRIAQMVEGIEVMRALWTHSPVTYTGTHYAVSGAVANPAPTPLPPILIGGEGERYLLHAVAKYADYWLPTSRQPDVLRHKMMVLHRHCAEIARDPATIRTAVTLPVFLDTTFEAAQLRAGKLVEGANPPFVGTADSLKDALHRYIELGVSSFQLVFPRFPATDDMQLFAEEVLPAFR